VLPDPWRVARTDDQRRQRERRELAAQQHDTIPADEMDDPLWPYGR
jgi:hypothetical protein